MVSPIFNNTPLENHLAEHGLLVKREDLCCPPPGPPFSKTRGVLRWAQERQAEGFTTLGVLDTVHSQGGWAVAHACSILGLHCLNFYPYRKAEIGRPLRPYQVNAQSLGAELRPLPAGRSAVLYHQAKRACEAEGGAMYPNALKLPQTVEETAAEIERTVSTMNQEDYIQSMSSPWIVSASSGTIAAGVHRGLISNDPHHSPLLIIHMGYDRTPAVVEKYVRAMATTAHLNGNRGRIKIVTEGYEYKDEARAGPSPPWACNPWYDLKAYRWWMRDGRHHWGSAVLWNIG